MNDIYADVNIDTAAKTHECDALEKMIESRQYPVNSIIICDRGYEKYNHMACCIEKNQKFFIRVKDIHSNWILSTIHLDDTAFDTNITKSVTYLQTNETKDNELYKFLMNGSAPFDYLSPNQDYYEMNVRAVRFKITEDTYECLLTNLAKDEMSFEEFKETYLRISIYIFYSHRNNTIYHWFRCSRI